MLAVVLLGLGLLGLYRAPLPAVATQRRRARDLAGHLRAALARPTTWIGLAFAAVAGTGFEAVGAFAGPLLTDRASGDTDVAGFFFLLPAVLATAVGGVVGGALVDRTGARRGTVLAGLARGAAILATAAAPALSDGHHALRSWLTVVYAAIGGVTAASDALFMRWTDPRLGATQFSAYLGATNLCESWSAAAAGRMIPALGYGGTFASLGALGLLALPLVTLGRRGDTDDGTEA
jgi:predicted MFS family arabinose efflux permease